MKKNNLLILSFISCFLMNFDMYAQHRGPGGRPPSRKHTVKEAGDLKLNPAVQKLSQKSVSNFKVSKKEIKVEANGIPQHRVGRFPSRHNPNSVKEQALQFSIPTNQKPMDGRSV